MQAKYDEAMKPTTGTLRKIMGGTVTTEKLDQMRKRLKVAARKASDAKNEYLLGLEAVNKHQHYYHQIVLPQLMRVRQRQARACTRTRLAGRLTLQTPHARMSPPPLLQNMDGIYYDSIKRYITDYGDLESSNARESAVRRRSWRGSSAESRPHPNARDGAPNAHSDRGRHAWRRS